MDDQQIDIIDLVDGTLSGPDWDAWLAARPELAEEVAVARRVRALMLQLQAAQIAVPPGFEARLLARVQEDKTLLDLLDLGLSGIGGAFLELLNALFGLLPQPEPALAA